MRHETLENCPCCGGNIVLYSRCRMDTDHNCFARCDSCKNEYPMPEAKLATYGVRIYPSSIKKAERCWNRKAKAFRRFFESHCPDCDGKLDQSNHVERSGCAYD